MSMDYETIGKRIKRRRKEKGLTQERFAELIDRSPAFIGHIERGTRIMSLETFFEIARALDCSADELLGLELKDISSFTTAIDLLDMAQALARERAGKNRRKTPGP